MTFTVANLNAIETAMATGELSVDYNGTKVVYRSISELKEARETVRDELIAAGIIASPTSRVAYARRERS